MGRGSGKTGAALAGVLAGVGTTVGLIWISYLLARGRAPAHGCVGRLVALTPTGGPDRP